MFMFTSPIYNPLKRVCRYTRGNKRVDPKISVNIRKEKAVINKGKLTNQVSTVNCG